VTKHLAYSATELITSVIVYSKGADFWLTVWTVPLIRKRLRQNVSMFKVMDRMVPRLLVNRPFSRVTILLFSTVNRARTSKNALQLQLCILQMKCDIAMKNRLRK
jgi:hypothetical protein